MKKLLFLLWINIFAIGFAQVKSPNEFITTYGKQITLYHQVEDYFKETNQVQMSGTYTSSKLTDNSREGVFVYYFSNGVKSSEGTFKNGKTTKV